MKMSDHKKDCICVYCKDLRKAYEEGREAARQAFKDLLRRQHKKAKRPAVGKSEGQNGPPT